MGGASWFCIVESGSISRRCAIYCAVLAEEKAVAAQFIAHVLFDCVPGTINGASTKMDGVRGARNGASTKMDDVRGARNGASTKMDGVRGVINGASTKI